MYHNPEHWKNRRFTCRSESVLPGGGVVGISEGAGVSSGGVSFAGVLGSGAAAVGAGVSFGGVAPVNQENGKHIVQYILIL